MKIGQAGFWALALSTLVAVAIPLSLAQDILGARLVTGNSYLEGRVEVYANGQWGTVCDDSFSDSDAQVICRMLGLEGGEALPYATYGPGSDPIWLDNVNCNGYESTLNDCSHNGLGNHNCNHNEDAGVRCEDAVWSPSPSYSDWNTENPWPSSDWATQGWSSYDWATQGWSSYDWATENPWPSSDWATHYPWSSYDWNTENPWPSSDWATENPWPSSDWATHNPWSSYDWNTENPWPSSDWATQYPWSSYDWATENPWPSSDWATHYPTPSYDCGPDEYRCPSNGQCIPDYWICDGINDCSYNEDEENCDNYHTDYPSYSSDWATQYPWSSYDWNTENPWPSSDWATHYPWSSYDWATHYPSSSYDCGPDEYRCPSNGQCIPDYWICDGIHDCLYSEDEENCDNYPTGYPSYSSDWATENPWPSSDWATHYPWSSYDWATNYPSSSNECGPSEYQCPSNGICIPNYWICDNYHDCPYSEDEENCDNYPTGYPSYSSEYYPTQYPSYSEGSFDYSWPSYWFSSEQPQGSCLNFDCLCTGSQCRSDGCYCDAACERFGDCCSDYQALCTNNGIDTGLYYIQAIEEMPVNVRRRRAAEATKKRRARRSVSERLSKRLEARRERAHHARKARNAEN